MLVIIPSYSASNPAHALETLAHNDFSSPQDYLLVLEPHQKPSVNESPTETHLYLIPAPGRQGKNIFCFDWLPDAGVEIHHTELLVSTIPTLIDDVGLAPTARVHHVSITIGAFKHTFGNYIMVLSGIGTLGLEAVAIFGSIVTNDRANTKEWDFMDFKDVLRILRTACSLTINDFGEEH
ncbi:hypothetical protein BDZ45DRAFT_746210 [Acephala macrosclerotiorum]|nr:hypothetical protein BDZ45DRAFT_746210 [Acephala macrosclerotiorum]